MHLSFFAGALAAFALTGPALAATYGDAPDFPCLNPPTMSPAIPGDTVLSDQPSFNCFAWQEFIAVNWPTGPDASAATFGAPGDLSPVVFETFHNVHDLLNSAGTPPGSPHALTLNPTTTSGTRILSRTSKLGNNFNPSKDINEAAPSVAWLADTGANLVWYEILVNDAEYTYFIENKLYNSIDQYEHVAAGGKIELPTGTVGGDPGAIEFKAAWLTVPDPENTAKWSRYKLTEGTFCTGLRTDDEVCDTGTIALIGLHILHKTTSQPSWTWSTFDHIDNVPDAAAVADGQAPARAYNFYRSACQEFEVPASCLPNGATQPVMTSCTPNTSPAYALGPFIGNSVDPASACQPYPVQATRVFPMPDTHENPVVATNAAAQAMIRAANPDSVFQYYQLINVLWSDSPVNENASAQQPPTIAPLSKTAFRPDLTTFPVSNPVLETYVQDVSCLQCHSGATIAASIEDGNPTFASDYSFIFGMAGPDRPRP